MCRLRSLNSNGRRNSKTRIVGEKKASQINLVLYEEKLRANRLITTDIGDLDVFPSMQLLSLANAK